MDIDLQMLIALSGRKDHLLQSEDIIYPILTPQEGKPRAYPSRLYFLKIISMKNKWNKSFKTSENTFCLLNWPFFVGGCVWNWECCFHNCHCRGQELSKSKRKSSQKQKLDLFFWDPVPDYIYLGSCCLIHWHPRKMCTEQEFPVSIYLGMRHCSLPQLLPRLPSPCDEQEPQKPFFTIIAATLQITGKGDPWDLCWVTWAALLMLDHLWGTYLQNTWRHWR